jgi:peptide methionine sulfoxide reductase MsrA
MTNNKQQTAIEWFIEQLEEKGDLRETPSIRNIQLNIDTSDYMELKQQAKEMEKEQQEKLSASWAKSREQTREIAMHIGFAKGFMSGLECHEDYYEELNKTQLDEDEFTRNYITDIFEETQGGTNESN